jgi:soluble lytic murein transglycosylase-like protein
MRAIGVAIGIVLFVSAWGVAGAADYAVSSGSDETVWRYTNVSPDGRESLLFEEESAAAAERARQRQSFSNEELLAIVRQAAQRHGVDPELLCAVAWVESRLKPYAVSPMGARGLMQLMPETARRLGVRDMNNPVESAEAGALYLRSMLDRYDNELPLALAAYNAGEGAVRQGRPLPANAPTLIFVRNVLSMRDAFLIP